MMNICTISVSVAAIVALSPAMAHASPEKDALNACAAAFAGSLAAPGAAAPTFKVVDGGAIGMQSASASCSTNSRGAVVALSPVPLEAASLTLASRL